jgi:hypothetical protein
MKLLKNGKPIIRCSSLDQLISCPASRTIAAKLGELLDIDDSASWEGQWCHFRSATRFVEKHGAMPPEGGLPPPRIPKDYKPDSFAEWIVDYYHRAVMEETPGDWAMEVEAEMMYEFERFWLSGHVDVNAVAPDTSALQFDDLKSGSNIVDPAECNWQVLGYAGLFKRAYAEKLRRIRGRIVQPRVREGEGKRVSSVIIDDRGIWNDEGELVADATIDSFLPLLERRINEALANPMMLNSGVKQCRWCPAGETLQCPCLEAERDAMKMELTKEALDAISANTNPETLVRWALSKKLLGPKLDKAWELLKAHLEKSGGELTIEGAKAFLRDWKGQRFLSEEGKEKVWEALASEVDPKLAYGCMDLSIPALEKAYAKHLDLPIESKAKDKDSGEKQVQNRFGALIQQKTGKQLTIVV